MPHSWFLSFVNSTDEPLETPPANEENQPSPSLPPEADPSMAEYYQLQQVLLKVTLALTGIIFISVWFAYSLHIALNYLIGACTGVVYLRMLSRNVAQLGRQKQRLGSGRLALFIGLIVIATQWQQLEVMPVFLGFLTYKAAVIFYMLRVAILPDSA